MLGGKEKIEILMLWNDIQQSEMWVKFNYAFPG